MEELYRCVSRIRIAEQKIVDVYMSDVMQCPVHLSIGQESIAAAICACMDSDDLKTGTHRSHAMYIANGGSLVGFFAELLGRTTGCSRGHGGSMHLIDTENGLVGTSSIVGGAIPISVGLALACEGRRIGAVFFGDGAADEGVFAETLNFAVLKNAPLLMVCENNHYSIYTHERHRRTAKPADIARAFGMKTIEFSIEIASDVFELHDRLTEPIEQIRNGAGPLFIECETVRRYDHVGIGDDIKNGFRDADQIEVFEKFCPVKLARERIGSEQADEIDSQIAKEIEDAYQEALSAEETVIEF